MGSACKVLPRPQDAAASAVFGRGNPRVLRMHHARKQPRVKLRTREQPASSSCSLTEQQGTRLEKRQQDGPRTTPTHWAAHDLCSPHAAPHGHRTSTLKSWRSAIGQTASGVAEC